MWNSRKKLALAAALLAASLGLAACGHGRAGSTSSAGTVPVSEPPAQQTDGSPASQTTESVPSASQTGGFDGAKAYEHVAKIVSYGPRPPASEGIRQVQDYIREQLKSYGCTVDEDDFHASP